MLLLVIGYTLLWEPAASGRVALAKRLPALRRPCGNGDAGTGSARPVRQPGAVAARRSLTQALDSLGQHGLKAARAAATGDNAVQVRTGEGGVRGAVSSWLQDVRLQAAEGHRRALYLCWRHGAGQRHGHAARPGGGPGDGELESWLPRRRRRESHAWRRVRWTLLGLVVVAITLVVRIAGLAGRQRGDAHRPGAYCWPMARARSGMATTLALSAGAGSRTATVLPGRLTWAVSGWPLLPSTLPRWWCRTTGRWLGGADGDATPLDRADQRHQPARLAAGGRWRTV